MGAQPTVWAASCPSLSSFDVTSLWVTRLCPHYNQEVRISGTFLYATF